MSKRNWLFSLALTLLTIVCAGGCQQIVEVEFYPPEEKISDYSVKATKGSPGRGPIKRIKGKSGSADFSDNKSFTFSLLNF